MTPSSNQPPVAEKRLSERPLIHPTANVIDSTIGDWTEIGRSTLFCRSALGDYSYIVEDCDVDWTEIGKFCSIARSVRINPGNHPTWRASQHHWTYRAASYELGEDEPEFFAWREENRVLIGHDVWIGHGVTILPGVSIGTGAVVGAGAVVSKDVDNYMIVGGVAAKPLRRRFSEMQGDALLKIAYWNWGREQLRTALPDIRSLTIDAFIEKYG
ncbi:MAG: DapH/DapD/GlmU-related protein [Stappiaceae bacterium]